MSSLQRMISSCLLAATSLFRHSRIFSLWQNITAWMYSICRKQYLPLGELNLGNFELPSSTGICQYALLASSIANTVAFDISAKTSLVISIVLCSRLLAWFSWQGSKQNWKFPFISLTKTKLFTQSVGSSTSVMIFTSLILVSSLLNLAVCLFQLLYICLVPTLFHSNSCCCYLKNLVNYQLSYIKRLIKSRQVPVFKTNINWEKLSTKLNKIGTVGGSFMCDV